MKPVYGIMLYGYTKKTRKRREMRIQWMLTSKADREQDESGKQRGNDSWSQIETPKAEKTEKASLEVEAI